MRCRFCGFGHFEAIACPRQLADDANQSAPILGAGGSGANIAELHVSLTLTAPVDIVDRLVDELTALSWRPPTELATALGLPDAELASMSVPTALVEAVSPSPPLPPRAPPYGPPHGPPPLPPAVQLDDGESAGLTADGASATLSVLVAVAAVVVALALALCCIAVAGLRRWRWRSPAKVPTELAVAKPAAAANSGVGCGNGRLSLGTWRSDRSLQPGNTTARQRRQSVKVSQQRQSVKGGAGVPDETSAYASLLESNATLPWSHVELQQRVHKGSIGKLYAVSLTGKGSEAKGEALLLRRLSLDVLTILTPEALVRDEAALMDLSHPHLLPHYGLLTDGLHNWGLLMPRQRNSLSRILIRAELKADIAQTVRDISMHVITDVASALAYLHEHGLACLCLHPDNVLFTNEMNVQLADYGRGAAVAEWLLTSGRTTHSSGGEARMLYYPPEILCRSQPQPVPSTVDEAVAARVERDASWGASVDVWSLGCLTARLISLTPLYTREARALSPTEFAHLLTSSQASGPADEITDEPRGIVPLIRGCTAFKPAERTPAAAFARAVFQLHLCRSNHVRASTATRRSTQHHTCHVSTPSDDTHCSTAAVRQSAAPRLLGLQTLPMPQALPRPSAVLMRQLPGRQELPMAQTLPRPLPAYQMVAQKSEKAALNCKCGGMDDSKPTACGIAPRLAQDVKGALTDASSQQSDCAPHEPLHNALQRESIAAFFGNAEDGSNVSTSMTAPHPAPWDAELPGYMGLLSTTVESHSDAPAGNESRSSASSMGSSDAPPVGTPPPLTPTAPSSGPMAAPPPALPSAISKPHHPTNSVPFLDAYVGVGERGMPSTATSPKCCATAADGRTAAQRPETGLSLAMRGRSRVSLGASSAGGERTGTERQSAADALLKLSRLSTHLHNGNSSAPAPAEAVEVGAGRCARTRAVGVAAAITIGNVTTSQARLRI